jgi:hypothetical protein
MVNPVSYVTNSSQINGTNQPVVLRPPSELYGSNKKIYSQDKVDVPISGRLVSELSQFGVGALSGYKYQQTFVTAGTNIGQAIKTGGVKELLTAFRDNGKVLGTATYNAAGVGAILSGGVSAIVNTGSLIYGRESVRTAVGNVVSDTISGAISGVGGLALGGASAFALSLFKVTGTPLVIAGVIGGAIGASVANKMVNELINNSGIRDALRGEK